MKLNVDCIRDILIQLSEHLVIDEDGDVQPIVPEEFVSLYLSEYPKNECMYLIKQMLNEEILVKGKEYISESCPRILDISLLGYDFIEKTKSPTVWEKIKPVLSEFVCMSLNSFLQFAISNIG